MALKSRYKEKFEYPRHDWSKQVDSFTSNKGMLALHIDIDSFLKYHCWPQKWNFTFSPIPRKTIYLMKDLYHWQKNSLSTRVVMEIFDSFSLYRDFWTILSLYIYLFLITFNYSSRTVLQKTFNAKKYFWNLIKSLYIFFLLLMTSIHVKRLS